MKQIIIWLLALGMCNINVSAQTRKPVRKTTQSKPSANPIPKDSREYQVGDDGFEWYKICKNGKYGAEDRNGNILVPTEYNKIEYQDFFGKGFCAKKDEYYSFYNPNGQCVIPFSRKYTDIVKMTKDNDPDIEKMMCQPFGTWYNCKKEGGFSVLCDINGKEVCKITTQSIGQLDIPHYAQGRFFWRVGVWDKNTKEYRYGILDGNGNVIIEPMLGLHSFPDSKGNFNDATGNAIANITSITTTKNPLEKNPYEKATVYTSSPSSRTSLSSNISNSNSESGVTTIVIEPKPTLQPMTEWVPCSVCGHNPGVCQTCAGMGESASGRPCISCRGSRKCHFCDGHGGRYQTVYR
jgi:hypothetical protein